MLEYLGEAPDIVIPGTGKVIEREAKQFCDQNYPVPIFIKRRVNEWEYVGDYKAVNHSTAATDIAAHHKGSITPLKEVTRVIFVKDAACVERVFELLPCRHYPQDFPDALCTFEDSSLKPQL